MTRTRKYQTRQAHNDDEPETNNETNISENLFHDVEFTVSNFTTLSRTVPTHTNASSVVPPEVKQYIDAAFEKQTLEIKALFQTLQSGSSFPSNNNNLHDSSSDIDPNNNRNIDCFSRSDNNNSNFNNNNESISNIQRRNSKRPAIHIQDDNTNNNNNSNKKSCPTQGEQLHTNNSTSLKDVEHMLRDHTQGSATNATFSLPRPDATPSRLLPHISFPIHDQDNSIHNHVSNAAPSSNFPYIFQTYEPIDYKDSNYDPTSELNQITNPIAKETETTRLWWPTNFKKDGWNRILNKPSKLANIFRSVWQTIAYN